MELILVIIWQGYISIQGGVLSQGALIALINHLLQILSGIGQASHVDKFFQPVLSLSQANRGSLC